MKSDFRVDWGNPKQLNIEQVNASQPAGQLSPLSHEMKNLLNNHTTHQTKYRFYK